MEQLPKIVREQLRLKSPLEPHPDADLLTAYLEQSLTTNERVQVNDHLAGCSECRQIVALAAPEGASGGVVGETERTQISGRTWFRWPILRWGAVACVVVVSGAAVLHFRKVSAPARYSEMRAAQPVESAPTSQAPAQYEAKALPPADLNVRARPTSPEPSRKQKADTSPGAVGGAVLGLAPADALKDKQSAKAPALLSRNAEADLSVDTKKAAPLESSANTVAVTGAARMAGATASPPAPSNVSRANAQRADGAPAASTEMVEVTAAPTNVEAENTALAKARPQKSEPSKPKVTNQAVVAFSPKPLPQVAASTKAMADLKAPRWTLSENGLPQRSFDFGKTWEEVQVDHKNGFRSLAAVGMDVWVGGKDGLLYHTSDMGLHWSPVTPASSGASLSADIVRIEFADPQHGRLIAGDGQSWVTVDGGKTWTRQ